MDFKALQTRLRRFAAERDWEPFHTPKNLAMALMVEAAELAEIFQWLTPEQSRTAHGDVVLRARIADELADVLLYLVQIADHTGVDLKPAVERKLAKNADKHPPRRSHLPSGTAAGSAVQTHVLVDWENVQPGDAELRALVPDATDLWLFHGPNQKRVGAGHASFGERATAVKIARSGKNALDFHLSFYMGYIASRHPDARFVVVSNDKGYAPMIEHAAELGFAARQQGVGGAARTVARKAPAKKAAAEPKAVAKKAPARKAPAVEPKAAAPAKAVTRKAPAAKKAAAKSAPAAADMNKRLSHVVASLKKTANKPTRQARLNATIKSLLGPAADEAAVQAVLARLVAAGKVAIDAKGGVSFAL